MKLSRCVFSGLRESGTGAGAALSTFFWKPFQKKLESWPLDVQIATEAVEVFKMRSSCRGAPGDGIFGSVVSRPVKTSALYWTQRAARVCSSKGAHRLRGS